MTIISSVNKVRAQGDGVTTAFDFSFPVESASELRVYKVVRATDEAGSPLTLGVDYTVDINTSSEGGTVNYVVAPTDVQDSFIVRIVPLTQTADIPNNNTFREELVEAALDKLTKICQQLKEAIDRCIQLSPVSELSEVVLPSPEAGKALIWNEDEDGFDNLDVDLAALEAALASAASDASDASDAAVAAAASASDAADSALAAQAAQAAAETVAGWEVASQAEAEAGTDNTKVMTSLRVNQQLQALIYPVGIVVTLGVSTNPATLFGFGTWTAIAGKVIVGIDGAQTEFDTLNKTGGAKTHTLTAAQMPAHTHTYDKGQQGNHTSGSVENNPNGRGYTSTESGSAGSGEAHNNLQPYIVKYVWQRTA